jgi:hypothetical protein
MVAPARGPSQNNSSRYPTIERSEASDTQMPNDGMIWNLNPDFNVIRLQTIMESIQRMAPEGSPLVSLAQQGAEVTLKGNHLSTTNQTIGGREPEVRQRHR